MNSNEIHWYAISSKPHKEQIIFSQLQEKGFEVFYPRLRVKPVNPRSSKIRPYFPGYLFVRADLDTCGRNLFEWLPGAHGLVSFGDEPSIVPSELIAVLRGQLGPNGIFEAPSPSFQPGDKVKIHRGIFTGYEAIFDKTLRGGDRVQVLLTLLRQTPKLIQLPSDSLRQTYR